METNIKQIARAMSRLSKSEFDELEVALLKNNISATLYRFSPIDSTWDEKTTATVFLRKTGQRKLMLVKTLKEYFGIGLKEAKETVDCAPCVVIENTSIENAERLKAELEECGATVEIH